MAKTRSDEDKDVSIDEDINRGIDIDEDIKNTRDSMAMTIKTALKLTSKTLLTWTMTSRTTESTRSMVMTITKTLKSKKA